MKKILTVGFFDMYEILYKKAIIWFALQLTQEMSNNHEKV